MGAQDVTPERRIFSPKFCTLEDIYRTRSKFSYRL